MKGRPDFYDKRLALGSMIRSFKALTTPAELIYLNDGPIPSDRMSVMRQSGEVITRAEMGNRGSISTALRLPIERAWKRDDLVWFAEDDYLYRPNALEVFTQAANCYGDAQYFGLYALIGNRQPNGTPPEDGRVPARWQSDKPECISGEIWRKALSTTSTFGARVWAIEADRNMMMAAMRCGGAFDHSTCLVYQGFTPYPLWFLAREIRAASSIDLLIRALLVSLVRTGFNMYAAIRRMWTPRRKLVASDPSLATHLETAFLAEGFDWALLAADTRAWMLSSGLLSNVDPVASSFATQRR
jgi:hypothetical protein